MNPTKSGIQPAKILNHGWTPMDTDSEKTLNMRKQRERRLAAREHKEHERSGIPWVRSGRKTGGGGKRWVGRRVNLGKGGQMVGKWCSFSHLETALTRLFPHNSTQVVDFPHICTVRLFWGSPEMLATDETQIIHRWGQEVEREGTGRTVNHGWGNDGHRFDGEMI